MRTGSLLRTLSRQALSFTSDLPADFSTALSSLGLKYN
jgi:hypothetical protein